MRGTRIEWPQLGRAWAVPYEVLTPGPEEVLIKTIASCVNAGTERALFMRRANVALRFPHYPGDSLAGEVIQVGRRVKRLRPGDAVATSAPHASMAVVKQYHAYRVPSCVNPEEASFAHLGVMAFSGFLCGKMQSGDRVIVLGHGVLGHLLLQLAQVHEAGMVAFVDRTDGDVTRSAQPPTRKLVMLDQEDGSALEAFQADVTYDTTGEADAIRNALRATRSGGRVVLVGNARSLTAQANVTTAAERNITLIDAHMNGLRHAQAYADQGYAEHVFQLMAQRQLDVRPLISERINPLEAGRFYRRLCQRENNPIGAVFSWDLVKPEDRLHPLRFASLPERWPLYQSVMTRVSFHQTQ
ncbi:MAG: zinc-binding alcohol dehydrogenase [Candidatus Omnitrophica bacterium]|nr:zinc-binding alcohol dehydrogenase [Candidatus Omnitrophota bacterium]